MQPHRRRCVQSSAVLEKESKHFMKAILPSPIHAKQIRIPDEFITRFGNELKNVATITVPDGCVWKVELMKCDENVFFCNKWQEFVKYYSIGYGFYLSFEYEGNSKFGVIIFDATSVEICYPFKTPSTNPRKRSKVETSESHGKKVKSMSKDASTRAEDAANEFNPNNPYFCSKIAIRKYAYVPSDFARNYLKPNVPIKLQNSNGKQWNVFPNLHEAGLSGMNISKGFSKFHRDNNLSHGDYCVFELIKKKPVVLKVTMRVSLSMQPRWRRCVRPSEVPEKESKHFMKAILPSPIHAKEIRIPDEFITRFGNELKNVATIIVPDGCVWEMELKKCDEHVFFCNRWQEFVEYYSIGYGSYLSFKYEGNSKFSVIIFDATSVEICYPFKTPSPNEEPNTKYHSPRKRSKVETSESCGKKAKSMSKDASKRAKDAANEFNPNNPYFRSKMPKDASKKYAYVPFDFAPKYLKPNVPIKLQNSNGEQWEVFCRLYEAKWYNMQISKGFSKFQRDNNLSHGDYCVFELIKKKPIVLKVTMFRAVDYRESRLTACASSLMTMNEA